MVEEQDQHQEEELWLVVEGLVEEKCQVAVELVVCQDNHHVVVDIVKVEEQDRHQKEEWLVAEDQHQEVVEEQWPVVEEQDL